MGLFSWFKESSCAYFPGCWLYFKHKDIFELYKEIFSKLDINYKILDKQICCGLPALELGYENEARKLARRNFEILKETDIKKLIITSPCCYKMFLKDYSNLIPDWNIDVESVWTEILDRLIDRPEIIKEKFSEPIVYFDNCYLGRYCGIYDEPRKILGLLGFEIKELADNRDDCFCCGGCGSLDISNPQLADKIAREKISQAKRVKAKKIITASIKDYGLLKKNAEGTGIEVLELSEVLGKALGIEKKEIKKEELITDVEKEVFDKEKPSFSSSDEKDYKIPDSQEDDEEVEEKEIKYLDEQEEDYNTEDNEETKEDEIDREEVEKIKRRYEEDEE